MALSSPRLAVVISLPAVIGPSDAPGLAEGVRAFVVAGHPVVIDLARVEQACVGVVDVLARLQLMARRLGGDVSVAGCDADLRSLLGLTGLGDAVPPGCEGPSG